MATIIHQYTLSVPARTQKTAPVKIAIPLPQEQVDVLDIEVPPGPAGLMGFYLAISGQQIVPFEVGEFIVWNDRVASWELEDFPTTGRWSLVGYNIGNFDHDVILRFRDSPLPSLGTPTPTINIISSIDTSQLVEV